MKIKVCMLIMLCMSMVTGKAFGTECQYNGACELSTVPNDADSVEIDSLYSTTFARFFDEVIDVDEVKKVLSEKFRKDIADDIRQNIHASILKTIKDNDVVSPQTAEPEKYEAELTSLSKAANDRIVKDFFGGAFYDVLCESYMPYFHQSGLSVEDMQYIISCYEDSAIEKALADYRNVNQVKTFRIVATDYMETCYRSFTKKGYLPTVKNECPELRADYDRMLKATKSDVLLDALINRLPDFEGKSQFQTDCREVIICYCMQRYKDAPMCLKLLPDLIGSNAYQNYIKGLALCNKNIMTSVQHIQERFAAHKDARTQELVNLYTTEYCDNYFMVHKNNPFSKPELALSVDVTTPGTLHDLLTVEQKNDVTNLKLSGQIDAADFKLLRAMMGCSAEAKLYNIQGALQHLDLSAVTFVESEECYSDQPQTGTYIYSVKSKYNGHILSSNVRLFNLAKMTEKEWKKFNSVSYYSYYNILKGDDFKLVFDGSQVHKLFLLKKGIIGKGLFANCVYLKSVKLPDSTNKINEYAFRGCNMIEQVILPDNVKKLENRAFSMMKSLQSVQTSRESIIVIERHDDEYSSNVSNFCKKIAGLSSIFEGCPDEAGLVSTNGAGRVRIDYRWKE